MPYTSGAGAGANYMRYLVPILGVAGAAKYITDNANDPRGIEQFINENSQGTNPYAYTTDEFGRPPSANMKYTEGTVNPSANLGTAIQYTCSYKV